jgi:hypothetical protein
MIDGSSDAVFKSTHERIIQSLSQRQRVEFKAAELRFLSRYGCVTEKYPNDLEGVINVVGSDHLNVVSCREKLHGQTYRSIMDHSIMEEVRADP